MRENKYLEEVKKLILDTLQGEKVKVVLFGSRARGEEYPASDVDVGLLSSGNLDKKKLVLLREKLEDLNIPYKVELIDLSQTSANFREEALKKVVVWKDCN